MSASRLLAALADSLAASAGSACHSGGSSISPVLAAMKARERTGGALRRVAAMRPRPVPPRLRAPQQRRRRKKRPPPPLRPQVPQEYAVGTLRLSVGRHTTEADVDRAVELIVREANAQRSAAA